MYNGFLSVLIQKLLSFSNQIIQQQSPKKRDRKPYFLEKKTDSNHSGPPTQLILFRFCHLQSNVISVRILVVELFW